MQFMSMWEHHIITGYIPLCFLRLKQHTNYYFSSAMRQLVRLLESKACNITLVCKHTCFCHQQ